MKEAEAGDSDVTQKAAFYDRLSKFYDRGDWMPSKHRQACLQALDVRERETILEIGSGTGIDLVEFARLVGPEGMAYGLDISKGMVEMAQKRVMDAGVDQQARVTIGDARAIPLDDSSCDLVFMSFTLCLFADPDIPKVLHEVRRVLVPNGKLGVVAMDGDGTGPIVISYRWLHRFCPRFVEKCGRPIRVTTVFEKAGFRVRKKLDLRIGKLPIVAVVGTK